MLRGSPNRIVRPVRVSTLATIIVSVRVPRRSGPGVAADQQHVQPRLADRLGGRGAAAERREQPLEQLPLGVGELGTEPERCGDGEAQHRDDPGAEHALPGAQPRRPGEQVGPDDDGHPGQRGHQQPDRAADEGARREQGAEEVRPVGAQRQHEQREQAEHERRHDRGAGAEPAQGEVPGAGDERRQRRGEQRGAQRREPADLRAPGRVEPQLLGGGPVVADGWPLHRWPQHRHPLRDGAGALVDDGPLRARDAGGPGGRDGCGGPVVGHRAAARRPHPGRPARAAGTGPDGRAAGAGQAAGDGRDRRAAGAGRSSRYRWDRWTAGAGRDTQDGRGTRPGRRLTHPGGSRGDDLRDTGGGRDDLARGTVRFRRIPRGRGRRNGCTCGRRVGPRRVLRMGRTQGRRRRGPVLVHAGHPLVLLETIPTDATAQERPREPCAAAAAGVVPRRRSTMRPGSSLLRVTAGPDGYPAGRPGRVVRCSSPAPTARPARARVCTAGEPAQI